VLFQQREHLSGLVDLGTPNSPNLCLLLNMAHRKKWLAYGKVVYQPMAEHKLATSADLGYVTPTMLLRFKDTKVST